MKDLVVMAKVPEDKKKGTPQLGPASITVKTGDTAAEMIKMFGDEAVATNAIANWTVTLQGNIRSGLRKGETERQMQDRLGGSKMGVSIKGAVVDPIQAYAAKYYAASPEEQEKMIANLRQGAKQTRDKAA